MKIFLLLTLCILAMTPVRASAQDSPQRIVTVGAFNYYPAIFKDNDGVVKGFYVEALAEIAKKEHITFKYVFGSWNEGLERIKSGEVDMLTSVAFTEERATYMDYCTTPLLTVWGELYALRSSEFDDILEMQEKTIGIMKNDLNAKHFVDLTSKFNIQCKFVEYPSFDDVFNAIAKKDVDAGVANVTFGAAKQTSFGLRSTGVVFNPFNIFFTTAKNKNEDLRILLDSYLHRWKHEEHSVFNEARQRWSHGSVGMITVMPNWLVHILWALLAVIVLALMFIVILRRQVQKATHEILQKNNALRQSEKRLNDILNSVDAYIFIKDRQYRYTYANKKVCELFNKSLDEIVGKTDKAFFAGSALSEIAQSDQPVIERGESVIREENDIAANGIVRTYLATKIPLKDDHGNVYALCGHSTDITIRKQAEEERAKFIHQLNKTQKLESLGILAGGIAHDFNNLMGGIYGYIDIACEKSDKNLSRKHLEKAMKTIDRARALTSQLLTFAKGGAPIQKADNLFPFIQETAQFVLSGTNISCHFNIAPDLWPCNFDKNQIGQVIDNLIINAQQAMPSGGEICVTARNAILSAEDQIPLPKGSYVEVSISDKGIGMSPELLTRIFDPFFTTKTTGHGLGLATCYSIVNRHGGYINVISEVGNGSTFRIILPAANSAVPISEAQHEAPHLGNGTFLIMDDEEVMRDTITAMLEGLGYNVISTINGQEAIDRFTSETNAHRQLSGMMFDLTVPGGLGGTAAAKEIRRLNLDIPIFVASGYAEDPVIKNPSLYGFTASICKPFKKSELAEMLNTFLQKSRPV